MVKVDPSEACPVGHPRAPALRAVRRAVGVCLLGGSLAVTAAAVASPLQLLSAVPACAIRERTGVWCPGCGMTRALVDLADGDLVGSLRYNALLVPFFVVTIYMWWVVLAGRADLYAAALRTVKVSAVVVGSFTVVRNLPGPFRVLSEASV